MGAREVEAGTVAVRARGAAQKQQIMAQHEFVNLLMDQIRTRARVP
jgi:threonyl-tRNA synthetase